MIGLKKMPCKECGRDTNIITPGGYPPVGQDDTCLECQEKINNKEEIKSTFIVVIMEKDGLMSLGAIGSDRGYHTKFSERVTAEEVQKIALKHGAQFAQIIEIKTEESN